MASSLKRREISGCREDLGRGLNADGSLRVWFFETVGFDGDTERALGAIKARLIQMPAHEDRYFAPEEEKRVSQFIKGSDFREIPGVWGHFAGIGANPTDTEFIDRAVKELLGDSAQLPGRPA